MINVYSQLKLNSTQIPAEYNNKIEYGTDDGKVKICMFNGGLYVPTKDSVPNDKDPTDTNYWQPYSISVAKFNIVFDSNSDFVEFQDGSSSLYMEIVAPTILMLKLNSIGERWEIAQYSSTIENGDLLYVDNDTLSIYLRINVTQDLIDDGSVTLNINKRLSAKYIATHQNPFNTSSANSTKFYLWRGNSDTPMVNNHYEAKTRIFYRINKNNSTQRPTAKFDGGGIFGKSFMFPDNDYQKFIGGGLDLKNKSFLIGWWAYTYSTGNSVYFFGNDNSGSSNNALHIGWRNTSKFTLAFYGNDVDFSVNQSDYSHKWTHFVVQYEKNGGNKGVGRLYINGVLKGTVTFPKSDDYQGTLDRMGRGFGGNRTVDAVISNVRIMTSNKDSFILSSTNVRDIYNAELKYLKDW